LSNLYAIDTNGDGRSDVITTQRIVGVTNVDTIGYLRTKWKYKAGTWQQEKVDFQTTLDYKQDYAKDDVLTGAGGYTITRENVVVENNRLSYPHFGKLPSTSQWNINNQLEEYTKTVLYKVMGKGRVVVKYEVPYAGKNFASVLFTGNVTKDGKTEPIAESYNFDLATGADIALEHLLAAKGKFWEVVAAESKKNNLVVNSNTVYNFYFDGDNLVLLYGEGKEFGLSANKVAIFLKKGEIRDEILTKQSNAEK